MPKALQAGAEVPGRLGPVMWNWEDNAQWGRLPPGWYYLKLGRWRKGRRGHLGPRGSWWFGKTLKFLYLDEIWAHNIYYIIYPCLYFILYIDICIYIIFMYTCDNDM